MVNYTYDLDAVDNVTSNTEFFVNINTQLDGYPMIATLILIWFSVFIYLASRNMSNIESFIGTNFLVSIVAALGYFAGFFALPVPIVFFTLLIVGLVAKMFQ